MAHDVQQIIDRILASPRAQSASALSGRVFTDEPILRRGSQMANYLPEACRKMRELARTPEARTRPEAWVFYHQALLMEGYEDDTWYSGPFEHYFPTYQAMSDRQLRGYFTWRTSVRSGVVKATRLSFVFVYLYELLCGVGIDEAPGLLALWQDPAQLAPDDQGTLSGLADDVEEGAGAQQGSTSPIDGVSTNEPPRDFCGLTREQRGFRLLEAFWQAYRPIEPRLDRYLRPWLRDYAIWHGLDPKLLAPYVNLAFDQSLMRLESSLAAWRGKDVRMPVTAASLLAHGPAHGTPDSPKAADKTQKRRAPKASLDDGSDKPSEADLAQALEELSSYRLHASRLWHTRPDTLRHVCCTTFVQLAAYYDAHRKDGLVESLFGSPLARPHNMFASAMFWSDATHPDGTYELDELNRYTCARGKWYWEGYHGPKERSSKLGAIMRACDQRLRAAIAFEHQLQEKPVPKYLAKIIDQAIEARLGWEAQREARAVHVDLSQLAGIRAAAMSTQEALLVDEEREGAFEAQAAPMPMDAPAAAVPAQGVDPAPAPTAPAPVSASALTANATPAPSKTAAPEQPAACEPEAFAHAVPSPKGEPPLQASGQAAPQEGHGNATSAPEAPFGLSAQELGLLQSLLEGDGAQAADTSLDMLVDGINEKLFDLLGDTALEYVSGAPAIIEDYREDIREALAHD